MKIMKVMRVATVIQVIGKKREKENINQVIIVTTKNHHYLAKVLKVAAVIVRVARAVRVVNVVRVRVVMRVRAVRKAQNLEIHQQFPAHQQFPQHIQRIFLVIYLVQSIYRLLLLLRIRHPILHHLRHFRRYHYHQLNLQRCLLLKHQPRVLTNQQVSQHLLLLSHGTRQEQDFQQILSFQLAPTSLR